MAWPFYKPRTDGFLKARHQKFAGMVLLLLAMGSLSIISALNTSSALDMSAENVFSDRKVSGFEMSSRN